MPDPVLARGGDIVRAPCLPEELSAHECREIVEPERLPLLTTDEVAPLSGIASQERALTALGFGLDIRQPRFHVVVVGASGTGRTFCARSVAKRIAAGRPTPDDVLLLPNPRRPSEPTVLALPAGRGAAVRRRDGRAPHQARRRRSATSTEGERYKQARAEDPPPRRHRGEPPRGGARRARRASSGSSSSRGDDEVQITAARRGRGRRRAATRSRRSPRSVEEFETTLATVQDEADAELRAWCSTSSPRR